jgi:hypothetical protein
MLVLLLRSSFVNLVALLFCRDDGDADHQPQTAAAKQPELRSSTDWALARIHQCNMCTSAVYPYP